MPTKYANRSYFVRGEFAGGEISVRLDDEIEPAMLRLIKATPGIANRALRHTAFVTQGDMKGKLSRGSGTPMQEQLSGPSSLAFRSQRMYSTNKDGTNKKIRKAIHLPHKLKKPTTHGQMLRKHLRSRHRWQGSSLAKNRKMSRAIGYDKSNPSAIKIGWLSRSAVKWAKEYQDGKAPQRITPKMRAYFSAIGLPTKRTVTRGSKPNPFIQNYFQQNKQKMAGIFVKRFDMKYRELIAKKTA